MRISDSNIQLWSNSGKKIETQQETQQRTLSVEAPETQINNIGSQLTLNQTYSARYLAKKQLESQSISEVTSADKNEKTKITNEQAVNEVVSGLLNKQVLVFNSEFFIEGPRIADSEPSANHPLFQQINNELSVDQSEWQASPPLSDQLQMQMQFESYHLLKEEQNMQVRAFGKVELEDGRTVDFALELSMQRSYELEQSLNVNLSQGILKDPLVINLSGAPVELSETSFQFDIDSDGEQDNIAFVKPGSGLLVLDKNGDGSINNGTELFGAQTGQGFDELAQYDADGNLWIDENDEIFEKLQVWTKDADGLDTLVSLKDAGVGAIYLGSTSSEFDLTDKQNNLLGKVQRTGLFLKENGEVSSMQQIDLAVQKENEKDGLEAVFDRLKDKFPEENFVIDIEPGNISLPPMQAEVTTENSSQTGTDITTQAPVINQESPAASAAPVDLQETVKNQQEQTSSSTIRSTNSKKQASKETTGEASSDKSNSKNSHRISFAAQDALERLNELSNRLDNYEKEQNTKEDRLGSLLDSLKENREKLAHYRESKSRLYQSRIFN
ncbi:hypothetical protein [Psychromonas ossibalaenae]|uniref:hypothetical protein n=1 Tax=Psychromonas ossibalaenae TaxID=444922 RepID=UPI000371C317|nr:hypothetical protein [Psychromonas ossibalaenae]